MMRPLSSFLLRPVLGRASPITLFGGRPLIPRDFYSGEHAAARYIIPGLEFDAARCVDNDARGEKKSQNLSRPEPQPPEIVHCANARKPCPCVRNSRANDD